MATSQNRSKIDQTKYKDIRYLHDYFVGLNDKKQRESTFEIHKKVATILRVGRTTVYNFVKSKSYEKYSKPKF